MRGKLCGIIQHFPLTLTLSLRERGLFSAFAANQNESDYILPFVYI
jgi:hypothetical protein